MCSVLYLAKFITTPITQVQASLDIIIDQLLPDSVGFFFFFLKNTYLKLKEQKKSII